jgi:hypothetical protein
MEEFRNILRHTVTIPEGVPGTVEKDVTHPSMVGISEGKFVPGDHFETIGLEDAIYDAKSGFQVRIAPVMTGSHVLVPARDRIEHGPVASEADALPLNSEVEEGLCTKVGLVSELRDHHKAAG